MNCAFIMFYTMFHQISKLSISEIIFILVFLETADVSAECGVGFFENSSVCIECPVNCIFCNSSEFCFSCEFEFSGVICQNKCNNCQNGTPCFKQTGICSECKDGLSGTYCNKICDGRCLTCDRSDVSQCVTYKNNQTFDLACPAHCLIETNNKSYYSEECEPGYWGDSCEQNCSSRCSRGRCNRENGTCSEGCQNGFSGQLCDIACHVRCQSCDRSNATKCLTWKDNQTCEDACPADCLSQNSAGQHFIDGCMPGYWGKRCDQNCSAICSTGRCDRENGTCSDATDDSFRCFVLETSVVLLSVLLVVLISAVVCLLCRQSKSSDTRRINDNQQIARRPTGEQISAIISEAYRQHSGEHGATGPSSAANEYILLTDTSYSESPYLQLPKAVTSSLAFDKDQTLSP